MVEQWRAEEGAKRDDQECDQADAAVKEVGASSTTTYRDDTTEPLPFDTNVDRVLLFGLNAAHASWIH